jgi:Glycoside Hydrolase Family 113
VTSYTHALAVGLLLALPSLACAEPPEIRGITVPLHSDDPDFDYGQLLEELPAQGASHVCLLVQIYQQNGSSSYPARHPLRTPTDRTIVHTLRQARALGLEPVLVMSVLLERPAEDEWRGNLAPPDWDVWFGRYTREVVHYAQVAEEGGAAVFGVGSELSSTEPFQGHWDLLIDRVQDVFSGELTYSANWDHYQEVTFWERLDYLGLSGYYELSQSEEPTQEELTEAWRQVRQRLNRWRQRRELDHIQLLFLEVGYTSQDGCARHPWDYTLDRAPVDLEEQRMCYQAFAEAWADAPELAGVFFYEWWGLGGSQDTGYTPRGKPALRVLRRYFGAE